MLDIWMDDQHVQLRQPVITDWASTAAGRGPGTGRVVTPMPGQVTKVRMVQTSNAETASTPGCAFHVRAADFRLSRQQLH